ncbi:hypothetical protein MRX96_047260 [Rhipicephalus microplus]
MPRYVAGRNRGRARGVVDTIPAYRSDSLARGQHDECRPAKRAVYDPSLYPGIPGMRAICQSRKREGMSSREMFQPDVLSGQDVITP